MKKPNLGSQDVRAKILQLRDSIILNLEFLQEAIDRDLIHLKAYYQRFGDLNYRPVIGRDIDGGANYGERTELMLEPVASKYRATIKSLLDSVRLIEAEILPEDNPEGAQASSTQDEAASASKRSSLRDQFSASQTHRNVPPEPTDEDPEEDEANAVQTTTPPTKLAETPKAAPKRATKTAIQQTPTPEPKADPQPINRPWRTKPQATLVQSIPVETEPERTSPPEQKSLMNPNLLDPESERIRAELQNLKGGSKMAGLMSKYGKGTKKSE